MTGPLGLYADFYELTMAAAYYAEQRDEHATFDLFVRSLPPTRDFLVVCGIETALDALDQYRFDTGAIEYLRSLSLFDESFLDRLAALRQTGEVWAMAEGELAFAGEPLLTISGPLIEVQLVETLLINLVGLETMIASKAARVTLAAAGRPYIDFSARRDHGLDAAVAAARASWVAGAAGTSLVEAGRRFGIPVSGTMAHSYVMAHASEEEAYAGFLAHYGRDTVLLIDTYDTVVGAHHAVAAMKDAGVTARGVRIDSGDLDRLSRDVRAVLDDGGFPSVQILASGDLDEYRVAELVAAGAPIDSFGVGTRMGTSDDAPSLGMVYKLSEQDGQPRMKLSEGKRTLPGRKQVWRTEAVDVIGLAEEGGPPDGRPMLRPVWRDGDRLVPSDLSGARLRCAASLLDAPAVPEPPRAPREQAGAPARIGVFGGTFDPPHLGHLVTAVNVRHALHLDVVLFVVANVPWQKEGQRPISAPDDRLALVEAAVDGVDGLEASRIELDRGGRSYTADTLAELATTHPHAELFTILGEDAAAALTTWERYSEVVERSTLVVVERPGMHVELPEGIDWVRVEVPHLEVSSTDLRARVADGRPLDYLLTPEVIALVRKRELYGATW